LEGDGSGVAHYNIVGPTRLIDTRSTDSTKNLGGILTAGVSKAFQVTGMAGVDSRATAVTGNLTVTSQTAAGWLSLGNSSGTPTLKTLIFPAGDNRANGVTLKLDSAGKLWVYYGAVAGARTHVIFDVTGYFMPPAEINKGDYYYPIGPTRIVDTRSTNPAINLGGKLSAYSPKPFGMAGVGVVPAYNAPGAPTSATGNLTVTNQTALGWLAITNTPATPTVSSLNFPLKDIRANNVTVNGGGYGTLWIDYGAVNGSKTDAIFDLTGFFSMSPNY
jgi:hypothetical protein